MESVHTLANVSESLFRLTELKGARHKGRPPAMHAFIQSKNEKKTVMGRARCFASGAELNLGDELDNHAI